MATDTSERGLENLICSTLSGAGWLGGNPDDYDREYCVDLGQLLAFLVETQPEAFEGLQLEEDGPARRKFLAQL
jgi:type I restriction enzyme, R subunit